MTFPKHIFSRFASWISEMSGKPLAFVAAIITVVVWAATGPVFGFSETWQLVINTGTTIVTFLMVFVLQNAQTRDTRAIQAKLDELIRSSSRAENGFIGIESLDETELKKLSSLLLKAAQGSGSNDDCQLPQAVRDVLVEVQRRDDEDSETAPEGPAPLVAATI